MIRTAALAFIVALAGASTVADAATASKKATAAKKAAAPALPAADQTQLDAAGRAYLGTYECDFKQTIDVAMNAKNPGYLDVSFKKKSWTMKPIVSSTGALRLEDVKGGALLLQIANKSMLMDTKVGQRLVDACVHENQRAAAEAAGK